MNGTHLRIAAGLLLLLAALASGWSVWKARPIETAGRDGDRSNYILHDFSLTALGKDGRESFTLRAPRLQETPGAGSLELDAPVFSIPDRNDANHHWQVRANSGWVSQQRDEIRLDGKVEAHSPPQRPDPVVLRSEQMRLFPEPRIAISDALVTVEQPGLTMAGRGMRADLATGHVTLQSEVRSRYDPTRR